MRKPHLALSLALATLAPLAEPASASTGRLTTLVWNGGTGLWFSNNWSIASAQPSIVDDIQIDGSKPVNSIVTLVGSSGTNSVLLDTGDQLLIGDNTGGANNTLATPTLTNNGLIADGTNQYDYLRISGTLTNNGTLECSNNSIFRITAASVVNNGTIDVSQSAGNILADAEFNDTNIAGGMSITGSGNISIHNGGTLTFDNPVNINSTGFINANSTDPCLLINASSNISIAGLTGAGSISASSGTSLLTVNNLANTTTTYSGAISGNIAFIKNGLGTQILSGNNHYNGATDINAGTLQIDNANIANGGAGYGNMTVHTGGTLAGIGSTSCFVTIQSGGTVSPGDNAGASAGTFTAGITLLLNPGSNVKLDLGNAPNSSDLLNVSNGEFEASAANIQLVPHGNLTWHHTYTLINWSGAITLNGVTASSFNLLPSGVNGNFVVDNNADTVSFFVTANAGDADMNGKVDLNDLNIVLNHLGTATTLWTNGNFDGAPAVDLNDLNAVLNNLGVNSSASTAIADAQALLAAGAPEPASLGLLTAALPLLIARRRRH